MPYYKAFWEPMWLAKLAAKENHAEWHDMAMNPETTPLAKTWREWERERIIKLLEPLAQHDEFCNQGCYPEDCSAPSYEYAIALIKGEQQ
jgi:hypothetical protein